MSMLITFDEIDRNIYIYVFGERLRLIFLSRVRVLYVNIVGSRFLSAAS